jgi:hypothetical protein
LLQHYRDARQERDPPVEHTRPARAAKPPQLKRCLAKSSETDDAVHDKALGGMRLESPSWLHRLPESTDAAIAATHPKAALMSAGLLL